MKLNYKFVITAIFLLCALLIAGCASNAAPEESMPPEETAAPFADSNVSSGIQSGTEIAALLGTWTLDHAESTVEDAEPVPAESENTRTYIFNEDGTGSVEYPDSSDRFEYAMQGNVLTYVTDSGSVEMFMASFNEDGALLLTKINNDNSQQELVETFVHPAE